MNLKEMSEALDLPRTRVAEEAWSQAQRRVRRRRVAAAGAVVVVVGAALLLGDRLGALDATPAPPATHRPTPTPSPDPPAESPAGPALKVKESVTDRRLTERGYYALAHGPLIDLSTPNRVPLLSTDPLPYAVLAISEPQQPTVVKVLGPAGDFRVVDVPDLVPVRDADGYTSPILRPTALSPDATRLALPQPRALVVVDLTTGESERIATPGLNYYADWTDASHVYVAAEAGEDASIVDVDTGSVQSTDLPPGTAFLPDDTVTWGPEEVLDFGVGQDVLTAGGNNGGNFWATPLVGRDLVIGVHAVTSYESGSSDAALDTVGLLAVDRHDGHALGFLATGQGNGTDAQAIGWYDGLPVISFLPPEESVPMRWLVTWDPATREITPLATLDATEVAWGRGLTPATLP